MRCTKPAETPSQDWQDAIEGLSVAEIKAVLPDLGVPELLLRGGFPERFVRAVALRSAQLLNLTELARDVGISASTAGIWLSLLERGGLATLLEPWFVHGTRRLTKSPKLYLCDTGLMAWLLGALWETLVLAEVRRLVAASRQPSRLHFWRDRSKEVDLLLERGGHFGLGDAKWSELPRPADARRLHQVAARLPPGRGRRRSWSGAHRRQATTFLQTMNIDDQAWPSRLRLRRPVSRAQPIAPISSSTEVSSP